MGSCYLNGVVDIVSGNTYTFQIDFVGPAPVQLSSRNLQIDMQEIIEGTSSDVVLSNTGFVQWGNGVDGSYRQGIISGTLQTQKKISGVWTTVQSL